MSAGNDNVIELGPHDRMKVSEALDLTKRENPPEVLILFAAPNGEVGIRSSGMANKDALWYLELAKNLILEGSSD